MRVAFGTLPPVGESGPQNVGNFRRQKLHPDTHTSISRSSTKLDPGIDPAMLKI